MNSMISPYLKKVFTKTERTPHFCPRGTQGSRPLITTRFTSLYHACERCYWPWPPPPCFKHYLRSDLLEKESIQHRTQSHARAGWYYLTYGNFPLVCSAVTTPQPPYRSRDLRSADLAGKWRLEDSSRQQVKSGLTDERLRQEIEKVEKLVTSWHVDDIPNLRKTSLIWVGRKGWAGGLPFSYPACGCFAKTMMKLSMSPVERWTKVGDWKL